MTPHCGCALTHVLHVTLWCQDADLIFFVHFPSLHPNSAVGFVGPRIFSAKISQTESRAGVGTRKSAIRGGGLLGFASGPKEKSSPTPLIFFARFSQSSSTSRVHDDQLFFLDNPSPHHTSTIPPTTTHLQQNGTSFEMSCCLAVAAMTTMELEWNWKGKRTSHRRRKSRNWSTSELSLSSRTPHDTSNVRDVRRLVLPLIHSNNVHACRYARKFFRIALGRLELA